MVFGIFKKKVNNKKYYFLLLTFFFLQSFNSNFFEKTDNQIIGGIVVCVIALCPIKIYMSNKEKQLKEKNVQLMRILNHIQRDGLDTQASEADNEDSDFEEPISFSGKISSGFKSILASFRIFFKQIFV